jgi:hypothetical protein
VFNKAKKIALINKEITLVLIMPWFHDAFAGEGVVGTF